MKMFETTMRAAPFKALLMASTTTNLITNANGTFLQSLEHFSRKTADGARATAGTAWKATREAARALNDSVTSKEFQERMASALDTPMMLNWDDPTLQLDGARNKSLDTVEELTSAINATESQLSHLLNAAKKAEGALRQVEKVEKAAKVGRHAMESEGQAKRRERAAGDLGKAMNKLKREELNTKLDDLILNFGAK